MSAAMSANYSLYVLFLLLIDVLLVYKLIKRDALLQTLVERTVDR